jgi:hypothetical protein
MCLFARYICSDVRPTRGLVNNSRNWVKASFRRIELDPNIADRGANANHVLRMHFIVLLPHSYFAHWRPDTT